MNINGSEKHYCDSLHDESPNSGLHFVVRPDTTERAYIGKSKMLHCCAAGYTSIEWHINGVQSTTFTLLSGTRNQTIKSDSVEESDQGQYICIIKNETDTDLASINFILEKQTYENLNLSEVEFDLNSAFHYLFVRPEESLVVPKGKEKVFFNIPESYRTRKYSNHLKLRDIFGGYFQETIQKVNVTEIPNINIGIPVDTVGLHEGFTLLLPHHRLLASHLIELFMDMPTVKDIISAAVYYRLRVNNKLFNYALSVAILHHPKTRNILIPPLIKLFPDTFFHHSVFTQLKEEAVLRNTAEPLKITIPVQYNATASDLDPEHRLSYFREDIGLNFFHWRWHQIYPFGAKLNITNKDRRGELFYYVHQQIIARYNFERLGNYLPRVKSLHNLREPVGEGYFPKLGVEYPSRHSGAMLKDVNRKGRKVDIEDIERWKERIYDAIDMGRVIHSSGNVVNLTSTDGIDVLGNMVEASILSPNKRFYGDMHNSGHMLIALCHDPDYRHLEDFGVMGSTETAMRDPIFYRWHSFIDDVFHEHKNTLPPYTEEELDYTNVEIASVEIITSGSKRKDEFITYRKQDTVDISDGLHYTKNEPQYVSFTHLQYTEFNYSIQVYNNNTSTEKGTVRIFLAPLFDERGLRFPFVQQEKLFIELDRFKITMKPGLNVISRKSTDSSLTIPFEEVFPKEKTTADNGQCEDLNYCGCGWPQHMLLPKGTVEGMMGQLFVMISNDDDDDQIDDEDNDSICGSPVIFCGLRDRKYPDKRSMGYPFDRLPREEIEHNKQRGYPPEQPVERKQIETLEKFLTPNMYALNVTIRFDDGHVMEPSGFF